MRQQGKLLFLGLILVAVLAATVWYQHTHIISVLSPRGEIARKERNLIILSTVLMLVVVIPVYLMTFVIAWRYREGNPKARYTPDWDHNTKLEFLWWAIPMAIIGVLAVVTFKSSHDLDPFKSLSSSQKPLKVQVVALRWRWLFIYPSQGFASVNYLKIPQKTPIDFEITSDAPMNSFWIPQLGGQIYAMPGMSTELHLVADQIGQYRGSSANISGNGFANMTFIAESSTTPDFNTWVKQIKGSNNQLNQATYANLAAPSQDRSIKFFASAQPGVYDSVLAKYLLPPNFQAIPGLSREVQYAR
jgi:cytochrome o ubiquinol oxidase subunit 2